MWYKVHDTIYKWYINHYSTLLRKLPGLFCITSHPGTSPPDVSAGQNAPFHCCPEDSLLADVLLLPSSLPSLDLCWPYLPCQAKLSVDGICTHLEKVKKEFTTWASHIPFLFQSCGTSLAFRRSPGGKGGLERAVVAHPGSAVVPAGWLWWLWLSFCQHGLSSQTREEAGHLGSSPSLEVLWWLCQWDFSVWGLLESVRGSLLAAHQNWICLQSVLVFLLVFSLLTAAPWCSKIPSLLQISALNAMLDWAATDLPHWPHQAFSSFQQ